MKRIIVLLNLCAALASLPVVAQLRPPPAPANPPATLKVTRTRGGMAIDGKLDDPGWVGVTPVETWYETGPGDNTPPKVRSVGYLAYDARRSMPPSNSTIRIRKPSARLS
ncbi:MAG: hypothetical protein ABI672_18285, partial [Vicinamibacteria bacterium]